LILLGVVVVAALAVWFATSDRDGEDAAMVAPDEVSRTVRFEFDDLSVRSPDLKVGPARVRGAIQEGFSSWLVMMDCAEPDGCAGEFALELSFDTGADRRDFVLTSRGEVPHDGELRFEGLQDPSTPVARVVGLSLEVRSRGDRRDLLAEPID
jgi:hypothetical protein